MNLRSILAFLFLALLYVCPADAASRFGVCTVTCTWDGASTAMWSASTGGATGASVPGSADTVTFDAATCVGGVTCTITVNTTVAVQSITFGACTASTTGCILDFSVNNNNVTLTANGGFSGTGTGTRNLKMGSGTWTLSGIATAWNMATTTNLTFAANSSTISMTGVSAAFFVAFSGGGLSYSIVNFTANNGVNVLGSNTFATLGITGPNILEFPTSGTTTVTNAFTLTGTTTKLISFMTNNVITPAHTISVGSGTATCMWCSFRSMTFSGGATFTASNSFDMGSNTGITITAPSGGGASQSIDVRPGIQ